MSLDLAKGKRYLESKPVNWRAPVELRGGGKVRLYNAEGGGDKPVHGAYCTGERWIVNQWDLNGRHRQDKKTPLDIVNYYGSTEKETA